MTVNVEDFVALASLQIAKAILKMPVNFRVPANFQRTTSGTEVKVPAHLKRYWANVDSGLIGPTETTATHLAFNIKASIDALVMQQSLELLISRHDILGYVVSSDAEGYAFVKYRRNIELTSIDGSKMPQEGLNSVRRFVSNHIRAPFRAVDEPMIRLILVRVNNSDYILGLVVHHFISDMISINILFMELMQFYSSIRIGSSPALPAPRIGYLDHLSFIEKWSGTEDAVPCSQYWKTVLEAAPDTRLEIQDRRSFGKSGSYMTVRFDWGERLMPLINGVARRLRTRPFVLLLAAKFIALYFITAKRQLILSVISSGRTHTGYLNKMIGGLASMLPVRIDIEDPENYYAVVACVEQSLTLAMKNEIYPTELAFAEVYKNAERPAIPIVNYIQTSQTTSSKNSHFRQYISPLVLENPNTDLVALSKQHAHYITFYNNGVAISGQFVYHELLYSTPIVDMFLNRLKSVLEDILERLRE